MKNISITPEIINGLDAFFAEAFETNIKKNLGNKVYNKIKKRIFAKYKISIIEAISDFPKFDLILRELFGSSADKMESKVLKEITSKHSNHSLSIKNSQLAEKILFTYGNEDKKEILNILKQEHLAIIDLIDNTNIPQATVYRRFKELINDNLVAVSEYYTAADNKPVPIYKPLFEKVQIGLDDDIKLTVEVDLSTLKNSMCNRI